jgi:hypothetical protein
MFNGFRKDTATVAGHAMHNMGHISQGGSASLQDVIMLARSLSRAAVGSGGREAVCRSEGQRGGKGP